MLNSRNRHLMIGQSVLRAPVPMGQFYGDYDLTWFDPVAAVHLPFMVWRP